MNKAQDLLLRAQRWKAWEPVFWLLALATPLLGSAVLALAVQRGVLAGEAAFELSRLDEAFQERQWGVDAEAAERTEARREEAQLLDRWFRALD